MKALKMLKYCIFALLLVAILAKANPTPDKVDFAISRYDPDRKHSSSNVRPVLALNIKKGLLDKLKNMPGIKKGIEKLKKIPEMLKNFTKKRSDKKKKNDHDNDQDPPLAPAFIPNPPPRPRPRPRPFRGRRGRKN